MAYRLRTGFSIALVALMMARPAAAELIGTEQAAGQPTPREQVLEIAKRPELASQLEALGIPAHQVEARVNAMTDAEVQALAGRLQAAPAGGNLTTTELLLIIILVVLIVILL